MKPQILVTGAAGFLGGRTSKFLASHFINHQIIATSRRKIKAAEIEAANCKFIDGDLCDKNFCHSIAQNIEIVVHCAALSAPFGAYQNFYNSNVVGTQNLINASIQNGVKKFIFISTPSIYFNFKDRFDVNEAQPLPLKMVNHYAKTKLIAENNVLAKNLQGIQTIALRPRAIIGAEDTVLFPRMLEAYHQGKLKIVANGQNICDFTCVRNVIESIICSINASEKAYGQAYNITDGNAVKFWDAVNFALNGLQLKPPTKKVPKSLVMFLAGLLEFKANLLNEKKEPALTKYGVGILAANFTLDISKAKELLNYQPVMDTFEGINEYILWHKNRN